MNPALTVECQIQLRRGRHGRKRIVTGEPTAKPKVPGRVPRLARLMALAIKFEALVRVGEVSDYADLARLGNVSRARITQIMNLLLLAPDIQEQILFLPLFESARESIHLAQLQPIAAELDWKKQRRLWKQLVHAD